MTAFVPATSAHLSRSSFTQTSSLPTSTTPLKSHTRPLVSKSSPRALVHMNLDRDTESGPNNATTYDEFKLFVGNISWNTTEESLKDAFSQYGEVIDATIVTDRYTGKSRGFGFIEFDAASQATEALEAMNGADIDGRIVRVDRAAKRQRQPRRRDDRRDEYY